MLKNLSTKYKYHSQLGMYKNFYNCFVYVQKKIKYPWVPCRSQGLYMQLQQSFDQQYDFIAAFNWRSSSFSRKISSSTMFKLAYIVGQIYYLCKKVASSATWKKHVEILTTRGLKLQYCSISLLTVQNHNSKLEQLWSQN